MLQQHVNLNYLKLLFLYFTFIFMLTGEYAGTQGLGLLRLHSTFRHDLKIYASDEGRVQMTAAAFAKVCFFSAYL